MTQTPSREQRIARSEQLARDSYYRTSVIDQIANTRDFREDDRDESFLRTYRRVYIPAEWFTRQDIFSDLVFEQFGSDIAFSEKKFIVEDRILTNTDVRRTTVDEIDLRSLEETADSLLDAGFNPTVLFAPIEYYVPFYAEWQRSALRVGFPDDVMTISRHNYHIFWSNKYMPFKEFIFIDKSFGEWISKPSFNERFYVRISESDKADQLDFLAYTTLKFLAVDSRKVVILQKRETTGNNLRT